MKNKFNQIYNLYHGTSTFYRWDYKTIDLKKCRPLTDFGQGFYTTSNFEQAKNWAIRVDNLNNKIKKNQIFEKTKPIVLCYNINVEVIKKLSGRIFENSDIYWATFIYNNRVHKNYRISGLHNVNNIFDYVFGHYADGLKLLEAIQNFKQKELTINQFCSIIKQGMNYNHDQLSFHSINALKALEYYQFKEV